MRLGAGASRCSRSVAPALEHEGEGAFQETPQMEVFRGITKWGFRVPRAERASWALRRALTLAVNGKPGPVYLEVPFDVDQEKTKETLYHTSIHLVRSRPDPDALKRAAELLLVAEKPVIVVGGGAIYSGCSLELVKLAELFGAPVLTTPSGRGVIPEDHPLSLG